MRPDLEDYFAQYQSRLPTDSEDSAFAALSNYLGEICVKGVQEVVGVGYDVVEKLWSGHLADRGDLILHISRSALRVEMRIVPLRGARAKQCQPFAMSQLLLQT